jgi:hypothetical protein
MGAHGNGVVWKDATGTVVPVIVSNTQSFETNGPTILDYADSQGLIWGLNIGLAKVDVATYASAYYVTADCSGTPYIHAMARWTYLVRIPNALQTVAFSDTATPTVIVPQSWYDNNATCSTLNAGPSTMFAVPSSTPVAVPTNPFKFPIHPEYVP